MVVCISGVCVCENASSRGWGGGDGTGMSSQSIKPWCSEVNKDEEEEDMEEEEEDEEEERGPHLATSRRDSSAEGEKQY